MNFLTKRLHLFTTLLLLIPSFLFATHNMGKDLEYKCLGVVGGNLQYEVTLRYYRNCWDNSINGQAASAPGSMTLNIKNQCTGTTSTATLNMDNTGTCPNKSGCQVTALCASQISQSGCGWAGAGNPPYPGVELYIYKAVILVPIGCANILLGVTDCCRNGSISNLPSPGSLDGSIQASINTTIDPQTGQPYCNTSVAFTTLPVTFVCVNNPVNFNHGAVDVDGDSLVYTQVNPLQGGTLPYTNINYNAGWSVTNPVKTSPPNSFGFNTQTGQLTFTPASTEQDVLAMRVDEYRNGVLIGSTMRDIQLVVINCLVSIPKQDTISNVQNGNATGGYTVQACPGTQVEMKILTTDVANKNLNLTSNISSTPSAIPGAIFDTLRVGTAPWDTVYARVRWTPTIADTGCHYFNIITKNDDCPINGASTKVYQICVLNKVTVSPHFAVYCGTPIQLKATGGSNFSWTPPAGLSATNTYTPLAAPAVDTKYTFSSDCGSDTSLIIVRPPFTMDAGVGGSICRNGQIQLNATVDNLYSPYKIKWVSSSGLLNPVTGLPTDSVLNPVASPPTTQTYTVYFTASNGCVRTDTVTVNVAGVAPAIVAKSDVNNICPGNPVTLTIVANPSICGIPLALCNGKNVPAIVSNSPTIQAGGGSAYPSPYGNAFKSARHQYLIKASELVSVIGSGGQIKSVGLKIATLNSTSTLQGFTIQMGCTSQDSLTGYNNNLITVFNAKNVTPQLGWNTHTLDQFYDWDGVSNLIIDICFSNPAGSAINNKMEINATSYRSQWYTWSNAGSQCGITGSQPSTPVFATFFQRPSFQFNVCVADLATANINWTPSSGPNAPNPLNNDTTLAHPISTTQYIANVIDPNGCVGSDFVTVLVDTSLKLDVTPDTFICSLVPIQLHANMTGSPLPGQQFTYTWTASVGAAPPSGLGAGFANPIVNPTQPTLYKCVVTGGSCVKADSVNVIVGSGLPVSLKLDSITCFNASNGKVKVVLSGGVPPMTYNWSPNLSTTDSIVNAGPNTYSVTVTDSKGCAGSATATLTQPSALTLVLDSVNIKCNAAGNGQVNATVSGGITPYTYTWNPANANVPSISGLTPGLYRLTVTDNNGCSVTGQRNITQPTALATSMTSSNATSFGGTDGKAKVTATGGKAPYTYLWSDGTTKDSIVNKPKGTYYVTVCDANLCCKSDSVFISDPPPIILTFTHSNNLCSNDSNAIATVSAVGGILPYTFTWNNGVVNDTITGLKAGTYTVTVADSAGITVSGNVVIAEPTPISITIDSVSILCRGGNNGSLQAIVSGGIPGYFYAWTGGTTANPKTGLTSGMYVVTVTDANNCTTSVSANLSQPDSLIATITSTVPTSCFGASDGQATVQATGGTPNYTYAWSTGSSISSSATDLPAGNWTVTVTDANNCTTTTNLTVTEPAQIQLTVTPISASCQVSSDGGAQANIVGGTPNYIYEWDGTVGVNPTSGLLAGSHSVTVTDANGCSVSTNYIIDTVYVLHASATPTNASCATSNDGSALVTANGTPGYTYLWDGSAGSNPQTGLSTGTHTVSVTDSKGCATTTSFVVDTDYVLHPIATPTNASCATSNDGSAVITANGTPGYTYSWDGTVGSNPQAGLSAGLHSVSVTDSKGCVATTTFTVDTNYVLHATVTPTNASCATSGDGSAFVVTNGTPGNTYVWDGNVGPNPITNLATGTHDVVVTDSKNCVTNTSFVIDTNYVLHASLSQTDATCFGAADGVVTATPLNGLAAYNYVWSTALGNSNTTTSAAGLVTVTVTDAKNCATTVSIQVNEPTPVVVSTGGVDPNCPGKSDGYAWASASGGTGAFNYLWSTSSTKDSVFFIPAGTYTVTATDANACTGLGSVTIVNPISVVVAVTQTDITCANADDGKAVVIATGGTQPYSYVWSDSYNGDIRNNIATGTYQITVADAKGCDTVLNLVYANPTPIEILLAKTDSISCPQYKDGKIYLEVQGGTPGTTQPYTYSIDGISYQNSSIFDSLANGTYTVYIKDANGCVKDTTLVVEAPQELVFLLEPMDSIGLGKSVTISPIISNYPSGQINGYSWSPSDGLSCSDCANPVASPYFETQYTLTIYYWANCVAKGTVTVKVGEEPDFYIPNAFSPNGDGKNDLLEVYGSGLKTVGLTIFNRWGEKVFDSDNQWVSWDGTYKGVLLNPGLYTYNAELEYLNGRKKHKFGSITLIR